MTDSQRKGGKNGADSAHNRGHQNRRGPKPGGKPNEPTMGRSGRDKQSRPGRGSDKPSEDLNQRKKSKNRRRRKGRRGNEGAAQAPAVKAMGKVIEHVEMVKHGVIFFDTHAQAKNNLDQIKEMAQKVDVLNIVIKSEGSMIDPEITTYGRMFAGEAWYLIHTRRKDDGWYDQLQPKPAGVNSHLVSLEPVVDDQSQNGKVDR